MKTRLLTALVVMLAHASWAEPIEKLYYVGEAKLSSPTGQPYGSQAFLLEKTHDPDHNLIVERAIVVKPDKSVDEFTMNMQVQGNAFTIKDTKDTIQGTGTLFGPKWRWTYFKADYKSTNGAQIEDENYMTDPAVLVGRKKISGPDAKVVMYMDITLKATTPQTFEILATCLLKK